MSVAQQLKDLRSDVRTLLDYAQALKAENERLRGAFRGSFVFLRNKEQEKVFRAVTEVGAAFPKLKTVPDISLTHSKATSHHLPTVGKFRSLPNASEGSTEEAAGLLNGESGENEAGREMETHNEGSILKPELFTTSDLADVLLEHNKLLGRLRQYTISSSNTSIPTSSSPNIGEHDLTEIGVVGFREQQNTNDFVVHASWSNGSSFEILRNYLDFFTLQARLRELGVQKTRTPELPLSDHLLAVLGRLSSTESLYHRYKLVNSFCKALLADVKGKEVGDVGKTSVLIFFVPRLRDIQIETTRLDSSYSFEAEGESDLDSEDCLGFLSSVALAQDKKWYNTHSADLLDALETGQPEKPRRREADLRFTKPSLAHPVLTHMHSAPTTHPVAVPRRDQTPKLSILKTSSSLDTEPTTVRDGSDGGEVWPADFRHRSSNILSGGEGALTRVKALCVKSGNMDWGVRETSAGHADQKNGTEDGGERNTSTDGGEELQCQAV